jgi:hypothetical protein
MRPIVVLLALTLSACGRGEAPGGNERQPVPPPREAPAPKAEPGHNKSAAAAPQTDPALAGMSPSRRRAYERGLADCRAGRYDPDRYPESYRIGCAAAHDSSPAPR